MISLSIRNLKLHAAARSMHQFCPLVRAIFPERTADSVIEAVTVYLYVKVSSDIFGRSFAQRLRQRINKLLKYSSPGELDEHIGRIILKSQTLESAANTVGPYRPTAEVKFLNHVTSVLQSMFIEADAGELDSAADRNAFSRFEHAVRRIKEHLTGIKRQHRFVMK